MNERTERRLILILNGAIAAYEEAIPSLMTVLDHAPDLLDAIELIGSALHWMQQEMKKPEQLPHHSGNARTE